MAVQMFSFGSILIFLIHFVSCHGSSILTTAAIDVNNLQNPSLSYTLLASQGDFGLYPPMKAENNAPMISLRPPDDDLLLCNEANGIVNYTQPSDKFIRSKRVVVMVPRGTCSFERKALSAQRLGASAIIIYGNLASRYSLNVSANNDILYPTPLFDYDCNRSMTYVDTQYLSFDPLPYNAEVNDPILTGNMCAKGVPNFDQTCPSQRCLLTGKTRLDSTVFDSSQSHTTVMQACCAWDTYLWLYSDHSLPTDVPVVQIPAFYITMQQADVLLHAMNSVSSDEDLTLTLYMRYAPDTNISSLLIWILGVFVAALAAYISAEETRNASTHMREVGYQSVESSEKIELEKLRTGRSSPMEEGEDEEVVSEVEREPPLRSSIPNNNKVDDSTTVMTVGAAISFMAISTVSLLVLFYFKIYGIVKILYGLGSGTALSQILVIPFLKSCFDKCKIRDKGYYYDRVCGFGHIDRSEAIGVIISFALCVSWTILSFAVPHPGELLFYWILQDIIGVCMCITFLSTIRINSMKVATILLSIAFVYDIFFVFISPHLTGGKSIMIDVATSGGPPQADPSWCEKYPHNAECKGGDPLPVLLTIPRLNDYRGGAAMLGLGDIILPGLLLSFAARYDEAKSYVGLINGGSGRNHSHNTCPNEICSRNHRLSYFCNAGYFQPVVAAYAVGLAMANVAVYVMKMGQPALLYLVPCCLGTMSIIAYRRGEFKELWETPRVFTICDEYLQNTMTTSEYPSQGLIGSSQRNECTNQDAEPCSEIGKSPLFKLS